MGKTHAKFRSKTLENTISWSADLYILFIWPTLKLLVHLKYVAVCANLKRKLITYINFEVTLVTDSYIRVRPLCDYLKFVTRMISTVIIYTFSYWVHLSLNLKLTYSNTCNTAIHTPSPATSNQ